MDTVMEWLVMYRWVTGSGCGLVCEETEKAMEKKMMIVCMVTGQKQSNRESNYISRPPEWHRRHDPSLQQCAFHALYH